MRNFPIDCEVIFTRPDDQHHGKIGKIVGERSLTGRYIVDVGTTRVRRNEEDICEASEFMKEKAMQDELTEIKTPEVVENPKINVPVIVDLESEAKTTLPVIQFNKQRYLDAIDAMPLEEITSKWLKQIKDEAIAIDKRICAPVKAWRVEVDEIIEYAEKRIAKLKAAAAAAEEARKAAKKIEVDKLIADAKAKSDLPHEYLAKIVFKPEYYQVGFKGNKLLEDLQAQFDTQKALKKGADDALALQQANIRNRELLLQNLNQQYGFNFVYSQFTIETHSDEQVELAYKSKKEKEDAQKAQEQAKATQAVDTSNNQVSEGETRESVSVQSNERSNVADNARNDGVSGSKSELRESQPILSNSTPSLTFRISGGSVNAMRLSMKVFAEKFGYTVEEI